MVMGITVLVVPTQLCQADVRRIQKYYMLVTTVVVIIMRTVMVIARIMSWQLA